jgi:hypothetical protein
MSVEFTHQPVTAFSIGEELQLKLQTDSRVKTALVFYKLGDFKQFQVRKMSRDKSGAYNFKLNSKIFTHKTLQYHFVVFKNNKYTRYPLKTEVSVTGSGNLIPLPVTQKVKKPFPVRISGNYQGQWVIDSKTQLSDSQKSSSNGNLTINGNFTTQKSQVSFSTTANYLPNQTGKDDLNVTTVAMNYRSGKHSVQVGDVSFTAPNLMMSAYGKRGLYYNFSASKFNFSIFTLSSQKIGGFGLPQKNSLVSGGMADYKLGGVKIFTLFLTGRDDPSVGANSTYSFNTVREGTVFGVGVDSWFLKSSLNLKGTYFSSSFSKDIDTIDKKADHAITTGVSYRYKTLSLSGNYNEIGGLYNSVGSSYLSNNQKSLTGSLNYSFLKSKAYLSSSYSFLENNLDQSASTSPKSSTHNLNTSLNFRFGKFSLGFGVQNNKQKTEVNAGSGIASEITSSQYTLNLSYTSTAFSLGLRGGKSLNKSNYDKESYTFGANMNLQLGKFLILTPTATYLKAEQDGVVTESITSYFNYKFILAPNVFTISGTGSYSRSETIGGLYNTESLNLSTRFSLLLGWFWKKLSSSSLFVDASYQENTYSGKKTTDYKIYGSLVISFY